jgi:hypothetical protein
MTTSTELQIIRKQADDLGLKYHHRAGVKKIQALIEATLAAQNENEQTVVDAKNEPSVNKQRPVMDREFCKPMTETEVKNWLDANRRRKAQKLVRCIITNLNPEKKDWPGQIISVGSRKLGTFKHFVPFNTGEPWHLPQIVVDVLMDKQCTVFHTKKLQDGTEKVEGRLIKEYNIQVLPNLTPDELSDLARTQALKAGQGQF